MEDETVRLSIVGRLKQSLAADLQMDPDRDVFDEGLVQRIVANHKEALVRRDNLMKCVFGFNALTVLAFFGKNVTLPLVGFSLADVPAALQLFAFSSSLSFLLLALGSLNERAYLAYLEALLARDAKNYGIDVDFLVSSHAYTELHLKLFNPKFSSTILDRFIAGAPYKVFFGTVMGLTFLTIFLLMVGHFYLMWTVSAATIDALQGSKVGYGFATMIALCNALGFLVYFTTGIEFRFRRNSKDVR